MLIVKVIQIQEKKKKRDVSFYRLPGDNHLKKVWFANLKRDNPPIEQNIRICHLHFNDECFERDVKVYKFLIFSVLCFFNLHSFFQGIILAHLLLRFTDYA